MPQTSRERILHGWADWEAFRKRYARTFIRWAEPPPRDPSEERYAIMRSDDHSGAHVIWARVSPNPDVPFHRSGGGFYTIPEEGKKAIPWAIEAAMSHKRKVRGERDPRRRTRTRTRTTTARRQIARPSRSGPSKARDVTRSELEKQTRALYTEAERYAPYETEELIQNVFGSHVFVWTNMPMRTMRAFRRGLYRIVLEVRG